MRKIVEVISRIFTIPELRKRVLVTLGILIIFRFGTHVSLPGVNVEELSRQIKDLLSQEGTGRLFGVLQIFSGGALTHMSVFALGIIPYITTSIIFSLLTKVLPSLEALAKEGAAGQRKIAEYIRIFTIPVTFIQSIFVVKTLIDNNTKTPILYYSGFFSFSLPAVLTIVSGTALVMWLGDLITRFGIGNGASIIIMCGIIARIPGSYMTMWQEMQNPLVIIAITAVYFGVIVAIVYVNYSQRRIPIQYGKQVRGNRIVSGGSRQYLPFSVNQANIMPVIFASSVMALPLAFGQVIGAQFIIEAFSRPGFLYIITYIILIIFFSYFWNAVMYQPKEIAENLKEYGSFIPGIRPGEKTANYIEYVINRLTLAGAIFLTILAIIPDIIAYLLGVSRYFVSFLGGTGILIVVGVALDSLKKIESYILTSHYEGILGKVKLRGRF
jgi:preprotein translocase subunit SecY